MVERLHPDDRPYPPIVFDAIVGALLAIGSVMIVASVIIASVAWLGSSCP